jgi:hypothetical protein
MVEHHGEFYDFERLEMSPVPGRPIPVYIGGVSKPALRRAARNDGWISDLHSTAELKEIVGHLRDLRKELGRESERLDVLASANDAFDVDGYKRLEEVGVTHLLTMPWVFYGGTIDSVDSKREGIRRFGEEIIANM